MEARRRGPGDQWFRKRFWALNGKNLLMAESKKRPGWRRDFSRVNIEPWQWGACFWAKRPFESVCYKPELDSKYRQVDLLEVKRRVDSARQSWRALRISVTQDCCWASVLVMLFRQMTEELLSSKFSCPLRGMRLWIISMLKQMCELNEQFSG